MSAENASVRGPRQKPRVVFAGSGRRLQSMLPRAKVNYDVLYEEDWRAAIEASRDTSPRLIVVSGSADQVDDVRLARLLDLHLPKSHLPFILFDPEDQPAVFNLYRWDEEEGRHKRQAFPIKELFSLVKSLVKGEQMGPLQLGRVLQDGELHYDHVERGDKALHVQTEVLCGDEVKIQTTVLEGGSVLRVTATVLPPTVTSAAEGRALIAAQHRAVVADIETKAK